MRAPLAAGNEALGADHEPTRSSAIVLPPLFCRDPADPEIGRPPATRPTRFSAPHPPRRPQGMILDPARTLVPFYLFIDFNWHCD